MHTDSLHNGSASGIVFVMCSCNIRKPFFFQEFDNSGPRLTDNSLMPVFLAERIPKVMAVVLLRMHIADRIMILFQTNCETILLAPLTAVPKNARLHPYPLRDTRAKKH